MNSDCNEQFLRKKKYENKKKSVADRIYEDPEGTYKEKNIILGYHVRTCMGANPGGTGGHVPPPPHNFKDGGHNINCPPPPPQI